MHAERQPNRLTTRLNKLGPNKSKALALVAVAAVGLVGVILTVASQAATNSIQLEAESGQLSGNYGDGPTAGASGSKAVAFGQSAGGGGSGTTVTKEQGGDGPVDPSDCSQTASAKYNWGNPQYQSNFNTPTMDPTWHAYGPEAGHNEKGIRTPEQVAMGDGNVTLNSDGKGKTAAVKWFPGQHYGRWEVCMKVKTGQQHYVLLTWPDADDWPQGGELDFAEESNGPTQQKFYLHCARNENNNCEIGTANNDARQWTAYALEWTPNRTIGYVNGEKILDVGHDGQITRPMHLCMQLDWFENPSEPDAMVIDWAKQWPVDATKPSTIGLKPGERATGLGTEAYRHYPLTVRQMRGLDP